MDFTIATLIHNELFQSFLILLESVIIAQLFHKVLIRYAKRAADRTKTNLDNKLIRHTTLPTYILIIFIGLYFALKTLSYVEPYIDILNNVFFVGMVVLISTIAARILAILISQWIKVQRQLERTPKLIKLMIVFFVYSIALIIILAYFKINVTPLLATLGVGGIVIGLALQNTMANFFAGFQIITDKIIKVGDYIELDNGVSGYVEDITWRSTKIRTLPNNIVILPNSKFAESIVTNVSMPSKEMGVVIECGVSYKSNLDKVEKVTIDVAKKIQKTVPGAVKSFEPFIRYHTFGDSNINFSIILRVEQFTDKYMIKHELIKALKKRYNKEKIEISWPVRKIYHGR
jgi:small-conductance mechanosensitive channel